MIRGKAGEKNFFLFGLTAEQVAGSRGSYDPRWPLLTRDYYMHLADLASYLEADRRLCALYADQVAWARTAILNVASSGKFSSDRTIAEYAADIWHAGPCPAS
jgi:glycogen phosphorylase